MAFDHFSAWFDGLKLRAIGPTELLAVPTGKKLCASSLKVGEHFCRRIDSDDALKEFKEAMKLSLKSLEDQQFKYEAVAREGSRCQTKIYDHSARLVSSDKRYSDRIKNEAALRYVLGDPIMEMICDAGNLKVC